MKVLLLLSLLATLTLAFHNLEHKTGKDVLDQLEEGNANVYVIMFYAPGHQGGNHNVKTIEDEKELTGRVLQKYPSFFYTKVNVADPNYADLVKATGIVTTELHEAPSVLIIEGGVGVWIHGPQTINKIEEFAQEYLKRSRTSQ
mmetsp:Transcript_31647/g.28042  ORF Transcript_31647/g.28042 Transcript_31647/m.28042 type:complete len:144 (+) Transcript_31647:45-476(+)